LISAVKAANSPDAEDDFSLNSHAVNAVFLQENEGLIGLFEVENLRPLGIAVRLPSCSFACMSQEAVNVKRKIHHPI
jgi:hypothetical protein